MKQFFILLLCLVFFGCADPDPQERRIAGEALGTTYHIIWYSEDQLPMEQALDSIFQRVNQSMSTYMPESDISRINDGDTLVRVDSLFQKVFELSGQVYKESGGYFDPTVGNLVNLYGFGPKNTPAEIDSITVDSMMRYVGLGKVSVSQEGKVTKESSEIYLDFNAIAKGYTVDLIGNYLDRKDIENYLIELGGELLASGKNLGRDAYWTVGIDDPLQEEGERTLKAVIHLKNRAMATSGNYRKYRIDPETGIKYVHTINPLTGYPQTSRILSASILAENCALADAYATTVMAMGLEKSIEFLSRHKKIDAYLIYSAPGDEIKQYITEGFEAVLLEDAL